MKFAVIDIGSNTAKAEIYKYKDGSLELKKKYIEKDMTADHKDGGVLDGEGIDILVNIMNRFRAVCHENGVYRIFPYATQSLRGISNADEVLEKIKKRTGLEVEIISGKKEAQLCFEAFAADGGTDHGVLSDMGGGSTELNFIKDGNLVKSVSLPFGSRSVCHDFKIDIIPDTEQEKRIVELADAYIKEFDLSSGMKQLYACGGTSSGMFKLYSRLRGGSRSEAELTQLTDFYNLCKAEKEKAIAAAKELTPERYDTVFAGIYAHICICSALGCTVVKHCKSTCRKGYAAALIRNGYVK